MKSSKPFYRRPLGILTWALTGALVITMTISDIYYSKLERDYPLLTSLEAVEGTITSFKDHFDYTYIETNKGVKRLILPTENIEYSPSKFSEFIALNDRVIYEKGGKNIQIVRGQNLYYFKLKSPN